MKGFIVGFMFAFCVTVAAILLVIKGSIGSIDYNINRATNYILSTQEIVSGQDESIRELRAITDEFRAQIKGLQKEVFLGVQKEGM